MTALRLALFGCLTSLLVGVVYLWTEEPIARAEQFAREATLRALLLETPNATLRPEQVLVQQAVLKGLGYSEPVVVRSIWQAHQLVGYLLPVRTTKGYSGVIDLWVAVTLEPRLLATRVSKHRETPGLGDAIDHRKSDWIHQFSGQGLDTDARSDWAVKPNGGAIDAFAGATITPRAVVGALVATLETLAANPDWTTRLEVIE